MELKNIKRDRISAYIGKYSKAEFHANKDPWAIKCDIAIPCATQNELDVNDAKTLIKNGCKTIGEGANMPCTTDAVNLFIENKILYAPGKASNAGGVAVSGLEMAQNSLKYNSFFESSVLIFASFGILNTCFCVVAAILFATWLPSSFNS